MTNFEEPPAAQEAGNNENDSVDDNVDANEDENEESEDSIEDFDEQGKISDIEFQSHMTIQY